MKTLIATLFGTVLSASFAFAADTTIDNTQYRSAVDKATADFKISVATCKSMSGNAKAICLDEAKVAQARANLDAVGKFNDTIKARTEARIKLADAEYALSKDKCAGLPGSERSNCIDQAKSVRTAARDDAKADRASQLAAVTGSSGATMAQKAENAATAVAAKTGQATDKAGEVMTDAVITTKVKADIFKEPELKSMAIHVETDKGVVMLSGFVDSKADADKAARIAGNVKGVTDVKSALKVK